ncbi:U3 small nucleolar RNA-associated protein 11, partial [Aureobasidium melanogenum]
MRNAVQRRNHKERAQPLERQKWGLLEKHKDYSLRAKDHNEKKRRLKVLREKAAQRNPDEFAFGMITRTTKKGVQQSTRGKENGSQAPMNMDTVKLLKTQDAGYLQTVLQQTRRAREKIEKQAVLMTTGVDASSISKRKVFDDNGELIEERKKQPEFD